MASLVITPEIEADTTRLAELTGRVPQEALAEAVRRNLRDFQTHDPSKEIDMEALRAFLAKLDGPVDYSLTDDEILGYDEDGIPEQPWLDGPR